MTSAADPMVQDDAVLAPVFLLAGGGRTGSTLIQRLIISSGKVLVWGEHGGIFLPQLRALFNRNSAWLEKANSRRHLADFDAEGYRAWIANLNPEPGYVLAGCRAFLEQSLGAAARSRGYPRWGFKEIRYGADEVRLLQTLFPQARFVFLVRHPASCLRSMKSAPWYATDYAGEPQAFLADWARLSGSLAAALPSCRHACLVRYEDAVASPAATAQTIALAIGVPAETLDLSVFDRPQRGRASTPAELDAADLSALQHQDVREVARRLGYEALTPPA